MNHTAAVNVLAKLTNEESEPSLAVVEGYMSGKNYARFQAKYSPLHDRITITRAMLADLVSEHELAFVLGHELGHRALRHGYKFLLNRQKAEREADTYSVKLMREKGYDVKKTLWWFDRRVHANTGAARHKMAARRNAVRALIEGM
jgi:Zn-dependent protease with chaperone function